MKNCQVFRGLPTWLPILQSSDADKLRAYRDPAIRARLRAEIEAPLGPDSTFSRRWDLMVVEEPQRPENRGLAGRNIAVLVEAAVRNTILQLRGVDTYQEFVERHRRAMEQGG